MTGTVADFSVGDKVNVRNGRQWSKDVWTVGATWWTTNDGRQYQIKESGKVFDEIDVRLAR